MITHTQSASRLVSAVAPGPRRFRQTALLALLSAGGLLCTTQAQTVTSAVPGYISYQGRVTETNGTPVGNTAPVNRTVTFKIWDHQSNSGAANLIYAESQVVTISVGEFSVLIGQGTALATETAKGPPTLKIGDAGVFAGAVRFLGITIDDPAVATDPEISPRQQIVSSAYAFRARYAESLGTNGLNTITTVDGGKVGIGNTNPPALLTVSGANLSTATTTPQLLVTADTVNKRLRIGVDSTGNGTGFIQSFNESIGAQALLLNPNGGNVGLGTTSPAFPLTFANALGDKISLWSGTAPTSYGFGIQGSLLQIHSDTAGADIAFGYGSSASMTETMRIKGNGNVGIGTAAPGVKLEVNGVGQFSGGTQIGSGIAQGFYGDGGNFAIRAYNNAGSDIYFQTYAGAATHMIVKNGGNVGMGTNTPDAKLYVVSNSASSGNNTAVFVANGLGGSASHVHYGTNGDIYWRSSSGNGKVIFQDTGGLVGIGTASPTKAKMEISGFVNTSSGTGHGLGAFGTFSQPATTTSLSLYANVDVGARQFLAFSDERIKRIEGRSNAASDLASLLGIEITNYSYIDTATKGVRTHKKVIAQQVEKIFPQAVHLTTDEVPDIYQKAEMKDGWVMLATNLKKGERVRLVGEKKEGVYEVLEVAAGKFRTDFAADGGQVFVFGRQVTDFRNVDYEAIAMLNVSATQQIKKEKDEEVKALRDENAELRVRLAALEAKDKSRDAKLAAIEKLLLSPRTVVARPASLTTAGGQE